MPDPTSTNQFSVNQLPDNPSQITTGSFTTGVLPGLGSTITITYRKVGKLYFGIAISTSAGPAIVGRVTGGGSIAIVQATLDDIATFLGVTINTYYLDTLNDVFCIEDNAGTWNIGQQAPVANIGTSFLAN